MRSFATFFLFSIILLNIFTATAQNGKEIYIDRFEQKSFPKSKGGIWSTFTDSAQGGGSRNKIKKYYDKSLKSHVLWHSYSLLKKDWEYFPYAGVFYYPGINALPEAPIVGIAYEFKGSKHTFNYITTSVSDYYYFKKIIPESKEWQTVIIPLSELKQHNYGLQIDFNYFDMHGFNWTVNGKDNDSGSVYIDNVRFILADSTTLPKIDKSNNYIFSPDSTITNIFNNDNDSLFSSFKEYQNKSKKYNASLKTVQTYRKTIDSLYSILNSSTLSKNDKESITSLLFLSTNSIPGDINYKIYQREYRWKKKFSNYISFDTLQVIDKQYPKNISTLKVLKGWSSNLWDYASNHKIQYWIKSLPDSTFAIEIELYHFKPDETIAEIGAGEGYFEQAISKYCNDLLVYVNEIDSTNVSKLDLKLQLLNRYDGKNIKYIAVVGTEKTANLGDSLIDKIIIKNTFHHFTYPDSMVKDLKKSLKKDGRLFIVDTMKDEVEKPDCPLLMKREVFMNYLTSNGFVLLNETQLTYGHYKCFEFGLK